MIQPLKTPQFLNYQLSVQGLEFERFETIGEFIETIHRTSRYYNYQRIHTKLKMAPTEFKSQYLAKNA